MLTRGVKYIIIIYSFITHFFCEEKQYVCTSKYLEYIPTVHKGTDGGIVTKVSVKLAARSSEIKSIEPGNKTKQNDNPTQLLALQA